MKTQELFQKIDHVNNTLKSNWIRPFIKVVDAFDSNDLAFKDHSDNGWDIYERQDTQPDLVLRGELQLDAVE